MNQKDLNDKMVLLLGPINHEGVLSTIKSSGLIYHLKILHSGINNWNNIIDLFEESEQKSLFPQGETVRSISMVLAKITQTTYYYIANEDYRDVCMKLFYKISSVPNAIYIFEDLLTGKIVHQAGNENDDFDGGDEFYEYTEISLEILQKANEIILSSGMNILPYKTRAEVTVSGQNFIEEIENGLIFRIYVPSGRLWEGEIERLLSLFRDYMGKVGKLSIRLDQVRTNQGIIYTFCGENIVKSDDLSNQFEEFSKFLDLCVADPQAAEELLKSKDLEYREISYILSRYAKEGRRLQIDMRHERESKMLVIRHRLESELLDALPSRIDDSLLSRIVDSVLPPIKGFRSSVSTALPSPTIVADALTVNINPQFIDKLQGIVAQEIYGDINLSIEDTQLVELFNKYGGEKAPELTSSLYELNDQSAPKPGRVTAKQKIKKFLIGCGSRIGDMAVSILQSYIEKKILGI